MVTRINDIDPIYDTDKYDIVLVPTNIMNSLDDGFQRKIGFKYPKVKDANSKTKLGDFKKLGTRLTVGKVCLLYVGKPSKQRGKCLIDYDAVRRCLELSNAEFYNKKVMTTMFFGTRFAGNWDRKKIEEIINDTCTKIDLTVYDYKEQKKLHEIAEVSVKYKQKRCAEREQELKEKFLA